MMHIIIPGHGALCGTHGFGGGASAETLAATRLGSISNPCSHEVHPDAHTRLRELASLGTTHDTCALAAFKLLHEEREFSIRGRNFHISTFMSQATLYERYVFWANYDETRSYASSVYRGVYRPIRSKSAYTVARHAAVMLAAIKTDKTPLSVFDANGHRIGTVNPLTGEYIAEKRR